MRILAYKLFDKCSITSPVADIMSHDASQVLHWLIFSHTTEESSCLKIVWGLSEFANGVLSLLPERVREGLPHPPHRAKWGNYKLFYAVDRVFSVNKDGSEADFYDLSQYFPGDPEPADLPKLQAKADQLQQALTELGVANPATLASPVAAFKGHEMLDGMKDTIPTIFDAPESVLDAYEIALQCTPREWLSNYQVGNFPNLWSYDLASAYPAEASHLLDLRDCVFHCLTIMDDSAYYGFLVGDFTVYPDHPLAFCSPFLADRGDGTLVNFVGTKRSYPCLLDEVRTLYRHEMGEFKLDHGWFISPMSGVRPRVPFQDVMGRLYSQRGVTELKSYIVKRVMNGIIGKLLEMRRDKDGNILEYGELYNPIYHALCTTRTRLQVFDFLVQNAFTREDLVHIGVDGIKATRYIDLPNQAPMGKWRCSGSESAIILSPGAVLTLNRNFKRTGYAELLAECMARPGAYKLGVDDNDPIDLRRIFLNQTRVFSKLPRTARSLLEERYLSSPVEL